MASELRLLELRDLLEALPEGGNTASVAEMCLRLHRLFMHPGGWRGAPHATDMNHAATLIRTAFPGFWIKTGLNDAFAWAQIGPDYEGPDGRSLHDQWPLEACEDGWLMELKPREPGQVPEIAAMSVALMCCAIKAEIYREERKP